jgi:hypothetical protein
VCARARACVHGCARMCGGGGVRCKHMGKFLLTTSVDSFPDLNVCTQGG